MKDSTQKKNDKEKKPLHPFKTFTKMWVAILLTIALIDLQLSYVLAFMGYDQIADTLSIAIVTEIIGVSVAYFIRAYFDSKTEAKQSLEERKFEYDVNNETASTEEDSEG